MLNAFAIVQVYFLMLPFGRIKPKKNLFILQPCVNDVHDFDLLVIILVSIIFWFFVGITKPKNHFLPSNLT